MRVSRWIFPLIVLVCALPSFARAAKETDTPGEVLSIRGNRNIENFPEAKRRLKGVFEGHQETLYCGCKYDGKELNLNSCGVQTDNAPARLKRLEWEHMVPAAKFGEHIAAWTGNVESCNAAHARDRRGRKCAEHASALFRQMEGDLYNLWPESGEINNERSNKPPEEALSDERRAPKKFGQCATEIGQHGFVPRKEVRGIIARAYLYMNWAYDVALTGEQKEMFAKWDHEAPPSGWECERDERIHKLQGNENPFAVKSCLSKSTAVPSASKGV